MDLKPSDKGSYSRRELVQSLLAAAVQGLTRAAADVILGVWSKGLL